MKNIFYLILLYPFISFAQNKAEWQHQDPKDDGVLGISTYKAYELLKNKTPDTVIVAIIDNGTDINHEDLKGLIWVNKKEIPNNGIDDDKNGYIDDINGWNFLGNAEGKNLKQETTEVTRYYFQLKNKYESKSINEINASEKEEYKNYLLAKENYTNDFRTKTENLALYEFILENYIACDKILTEFFKKPDYTEAEVKKIKKRHKELKKAKEFMLLIYADKLTKAKIEKLVADTKRDIETRLNPNFSARAEMVGDKPNDISDSIYGNNMVNACGPSHGTGVAGVVGALDNGIGATGVARCVKFMILRIVPNGDERDKDIALAYRYAVRNGASIINCSFGKRFSPQAEFVDQAMIEAENAGVLIVHAAGNNGTNNDSIPHYPTGVFLNGKIPNNWITVGASSNKDNEYLVASFSNYGKKSVDVFAPGVELLNINLNNKYDLVSGTSVASPVVAGIAAVLKSYYPYLSAKQLKEIILKSVYIPKTKMVELPGRTTDKKDFSALSVSGGIVNLYNAILLVESSYKNK
ncbi:MAG: S8 family serine peptidase [Bacteroidota bacterium]